MKGIAIVLCCMLTVCAQAEEHTDTTVIYGDKRIVIGELNGEPDFKVFDRKDCYMTKIKESVFANGNEEERVFAGMSMQGIKDLDKRTFYSGMPTVWYGFGSLTRKPFSGSYEGTRAHRTGSFELGITPYSKAFALNKNKTIGIVAGVQLVYSRYSFDKNHAMRHDGNMIERTDNGTTTTNNMHFGALRLPVLFRIQSPDNLFAYNIGMSFEARTNAKYNFASTDNMTGVPDYLRLKRFGINFETGMEFGLITVGGTIGMTPLFKTTDGFKPSICTITIGIDLLKAYRFAGRHKSKKAY